MKKYFKTKGEALKECRERRHTCSDVDVWKMPKGTRHHGEFAVCSYTEYLNTY